MGSANADTLSVQLDRLQRMILQISATNLSTGQKEKSPTCPSMSTFGAEEKIRYCDKAYVVVTDGTEIVRCSDPFFANTFSNKEEMNDHLFPVFVLLSSVEDARDGIIVVNSERTLWLFDPNDSDGKRKPDFVRIHKAFFKLAANPHGSHTTLHYGGVLPEFVDQVLFFYDGKLDDIKDDTNLGVAINYMNLLANNDLQQPRGLLFNNQDLLAIDFNTSTWTSGKWTTTSKADLRNFILGVEYAPLTSALVQACSALQVECVLGGYIGKGGNGFTFKVEDRTKTEMVLKICLNSTRDNTFVQRIEDEYHRALMVSTHAKAKDFVIPIKENGLCTADNFGALLFEERGLSVKTCSWQKRQRLLQLLFDLHSAGFAHGDARVDNVIEVHGAMKFIDFATVVRLADRKDRGPHLVAVDVKKMIQSCGWKYRDFNTMIEKIDAYATTVLSDCNNAHSILLKEIHSLLVA